MVTFISDYGQHDEYVAAVHAGILGYLPGERVIDISHSVPPFSIVTAAYLLRSCFQRFPEGTLHLIGMESATAEGQEYKAVKMEGHYFLGLDNGIFSLLSEHPAEMVRKLTVDANDSFPYQASLLPTIAAIAQGADLSAIGESTTLERLLHLQPRITKNRMNGQVVHIDRYGNAAVNIPGPPITQFGQGRQMTIGIGRERIKHLSPGYNSELPGEVMALINYRGFLEIAVNQGNAAELLGLHYQSPVTITFRPEI